MKKLIKLSTICKGRNTLLSIRYDMIMISIPRISLFAHVLADFVFATLDTIGFKEQVSSN